MSVIYSYRNRNDLISFHTKTISKKYKNKDNEHERDGLRKRNVSEWNKSVHNKHGINTH